MCLRLKNVEKKKWHLSFPPPWKLQTSLASGTPGFLSTCLGIDSLTLSVVLSDVFFMITLGLWDLATISQGPCTFFNPWHQRIHDINMAHEVTWLKCIPGFSILKLPFFPFPYSIHFKESLSTLSDFTLREWEIKLYIMEGRLSNCGHMLNHW